MQKIVAVRRDNEKVHYYFIENIEDLKLGDKVVVDFDDFQTVVSVSKLGLTVSDDKAIELKKIVRRATDSDISKYEMLKKKAKAFLPEIKKKSLNLGLMMKFVSAEYSLDSTKILIVFSSEERVDFRQLLKELAVMLKARIELKQIGQRDEVKICGAVGQCGQPCCCSRFLNDFEHVTVKMAKIQGLSLSPTKINGICGRLMCCLAYETSMYEESLEKMPKVGSEIETPNGIGTVVYNDILRERVSVKRKADGDTFVVEDFSLEELANPEIVKKRNEEKLQNFLESIESTSQNEEKTDTVEEVSKEDLKTTEKTQRNNNENLSNIDKQNINSSENKSKEQNKNNNSWNNRNNEKDKNYSGKKHFKKNFNNNNKKK